MEEDRQKVELFISCRSVTEISNKLDPQVILLIYDQQAEKWYEYDKTEVSDSTSNPDFAKTFIIDFIFEQQQKLKFIYMDNSSKNGSEYMSEVETTLGKIVGNRNNMLMLDWEGKKKSGKIIIRAEKLDAANDYLQIQIQLLNVKSQRWFSKTKPYIRFYKTKENNQNIKVYESQKEIYKGSILDYEQENIRINKLCSMDYDSPIILELLDHHSNGEHKLIGSTTFSLNQLQADPEQLLPIYKTNNQNDQVATVKFKVFKIVLKASFIEYLRGGTQLNLIAAIDFTGSNGIPTSANSLHYMNPNKNVINQYQQAIQNVGEILINYDYDKLVPVFGFGGKPRLISSKTEHCFPLNMNVENPDVYGVEGIMQAYKEQLPNIELSGPTIFGPLLAETNRICQAQIESGDHTNYYILLILTDGSIHDMENTIDQIFMAADLPLSIIIVGIGNADFDLMVTLDGDDGLFDRRGNKCWRDLVQFVPFNDFKHNPTLLSKEVLEELPDQLVEYYMSKNIKPNQSQEQNINAVLDNPDIIQVESEFNDNDQHLRGINRSISNNKSIAMNNRNISDNPYAKIM